MNPDTHAASNLFFIKPSHPAYRAWIRQVMANKKENRPESSPEPQSFVSRWAELALSAELWHPMGLQSERVLMWRSKNRYGQSVLHFRELDGVGRLASKQLLVCEVKASWSKHSFGHGVGQLKESLSLLARNGIAAKGMLILLDTRAINDVAGYLPDDVIHEMASQKDVQILDAWADLAASEAAVSLRLLNGMECERLIATYGLPPEFDNQRSA